MQGIGFNLIWAKTKLGTGQWRRRAKANRFKKKRRLTWMPPGGMKVETKV